jgi:hypothetical protein
LAHDLCDLDHAIATTTEPPAENEILRPSEQASRDTASRPQGELSKMFTPFAEHVPLLALIAALGLVAFARRQRRVPRRVAAGRLDPIGRPSGATGRG